MRYKIEKLILNNPKRIKLADTTYIEWTPKSNIMTILGRNGCGKSSVLDELTVCPAHNRDYGKGGYKEIHVRAGNDYYVLSSHFKTGNGTGQHSFIKNNVELNQGGTYTIQEELVWHEFRMNRDIHSILTGQQLFTNMSTSKRRELITMMSPVDLDFVFKLLDQINKSSRDSVGVIKHLERRLKDESDDIPDENQVSLIKRKVNDNVEKLNTLLQLKVTGLSPIFKDINQPKYLLDEWLVKAKKLLNYYPVLKDSEVVYTTEQYRDRIAKKESEYNALNNYITHLVEELESIKDKNVTTLTVDPAEIEYLKQDIEAIGKTIDVTFDKINNNLGKFPLFKLGDIYDPNAKLTTVFDRWYGILLAFPDNPNGLFSRNKLVENQQLNKELENKRTAIQDKLIIYGRRLAELKECQSVECPQCTHQFVPGIDPNEQTKLIDYVQRCEKALVELDKQIHTCKIYIEQCTEYVGYIQQFTQLTRDYPEFNQLWDFCIENKVMVENPSGWSNEALTWFQNMENYILIEGLEKDLTNKKNRLINLEAIDKDAVDYIKKKIHTLNETITTKTNQLVNFKQQYDQYRKTGDDIQRFINLANELVDQYNVLMESVAEHFKWLVNEGINEEIKLGQCDLAEYQNQLTRFERQEAVLVSLQKERTDTLNEQTELTFLSKALSVKDGLIGKYLLESLSSVLTLVNSIISNIWTYEMVVLPSKLDKEGLDYNFPLDVRNGSVTPADIKLGSESQKDIVNFAFKLAFIKFMGYDGWPLFLDEFGRTFDEQHRDNTVPFIQNLIEQGEFDQVFYISHFESTYGSFNNVEYMVLDPTNITVPHIYNENVIIR